ncbi:hypothetical protein KSS87_000439 [Heliosperma pusillum]|nr:hypothetical protein KSS87_000439 [Heliosperma pusillum]
MGGSERHNMVNLYDLLHHHNNKNKDEIKNVPKGCMAIMVGREEEEELQRFVIPIIYVNHPLFINLLKEAEEEYGFKHKGPITIPCHVEEFKHVQGLIDQEQNNHHSHHHHSHNNHHQHHNFLCFKA